MHMDEPLVKSDYFTLMKRIRLMVDPPPMYCGLVIIWLPLPQERRLLQAIEGPALETGRHNRKSATSSSKEPVNAHEDQWFTASIPVPEPVYRPVVSNPLAHNKSSDSEVEVVGQRILKHALLKTVERVLPRYDYDNSGTINGEDEAMQLTTYLAVGLTPSSGWQLQIKSKGGQALNPEMLQSSIRKMEADRGLLVSNPMTVPEYIEWVFGAFDVTGQEHGDNVV